MLSTSQRSGSNNSDKCEPKQNDCTKAGTGPACSDDSEIGADKKSRCLEEVRNRCDVRLQKCVEICKEVTTKRFRNDPDVTEGAENIPSKGYWWADSAWITDKDAQIEAYMTPGNRGGFGQRLGRSGSDMLYQYNIMIDNIDMCSECYEQALQECETRDCYCDQYKCGGFTDGKGGVGGGDEEDPTVTDVDKTATNNASYETTSRYGVPVELVYTRSFMPGNVFFLTEPREVRKTSTKVSFDATKNVITKTHLLTIANYSDLFVGLCAGEIGAVTRVFFDGGLVYSANNAALTPPGENALKFITMKGSEAQKVRAEQAKVAGFGRVPAYRGLAYTVIKNFNFSTYDDFPQMKFEVVKAVDTETQYITSAAIPGMTDDVWRVDGPANRLVVSTATGVRVLTLDGLEEVWSETVADVLDVTPIGKILTYDGTQVGVYDPGLSASYGSFEPSLPIAQSFVFRTIDTAGNASVSLVSMDSDGNAMVEEIDDITPAFPTDSVAIQQLDGFDTEVPEVAAELYWETDESRKSLFFARVLEGSPDTVRVRELRMYSSNTTENLLEDEQWYGYDLPVSTFGGTTSLILQGIIPCQFDGTLILAYIRSGGAGFVKWSPTEGVVWSVTAANVPFFGKYAPFDDPTQKVLAYVANAGAINILDLETGEITTRAGTYATPDGFQYYDSATASVIYQSTGNTVSRAFLNRVSTSMETLATVAADLAERSGIDPGYVDAYDVSGIEITGIRSGDNDTGAEIMEQLNTVYMTVALANERFIVRRRSNTSSVAINPDDLKTALDMAREFEKVQDKSVTLEYFSDNLNGDENFQTFSLMTGDARNAELVDERFSFTVLEDDTYMKQLAEMLVHTELKSRDVYPIGLPPRYLALTSGDVISVNGLSLRVSEDTLGADNTLELDALRDSPADYEDFAPIVGTPGLSASFYKDFSGAVGAPIAVSARSIEQSSAPSVGVYAGVSNILGEFTAPTSFGYANDEAEATVTGGTHTTNESLVWGRLYAIDAPIGTAVLKTFRSHSLAIRFPEEAMAARVLDMPTRWGQSPDPRTMDSYYNTLLVGRELIQYGYTAAHPTDPQVVIFHNLQRGRHNTDDALDHMLGEMCILVEEGVHRRYELGADLSGHSLKLTTGKGQNPGRRADVTPYEAALLPSIPGYLLRQDFAITEPVYRSASHPGNPAVLITLRQRELVSYGLTEDSASLLTASENNASYKGQLSLYLLRADYDPILFEAERNGTGTSYIVARVPSMPVAASSSDFEPPPSAGSFKTWFLSYIWRGDLQSPTLWNHLTEPLVAVIISTNDYGESRAVFKWHAAGDYTKRQTRGLDGTAT